MGVFKMQKAKHLHLELEKVTPNIHHDYMITEKVDGWYVEAEYSFGEGWKRIVSSSGRYIPSMETVAREVLNDKVVAPFSHTKLIMEAYIPDTKFHILNGIFNRSTGNYKAEDVHFIVHDCVSLDNKEALPALDRFNMISKLNLPSRFDRAELLAISNNQAIWRRYFDLVVSRGGEGIILKQADGLYQPGKRNSSLLKLKELIEADLLCTELYYTIGEKGNSNMNLILVSKAGVETTVRVAKHEDIEEFERDNTSVVGQVVKIKAMKRLEGGKFREPRFDYVREDKELWDID